MPLRAASLVAVAVLALGCGRPSSGGGSVEATAEPAYGPLVSSLTSSPQGAGAKGVDPTAGADAEWNPAQIAWHGYDEGLATAKAQNKPVLLVFFANWCPHCHKYSHVFADPRVVEKSRQLVMVRVNADDDSDVSHKFAPDGSYVPRTFVLSPDGAMDPGITAKRPKFRHFFDEHDPSSVLAAMDEAVKKYGG